jgi:hypothetical protein
VPSLATATLWMLYLLTSCFSKYFNAAFTSLTR